MQCGGDDLDLGGQTFSIFQKYLYPNYTNKLLKKLWITHKLVDKWWLVEVPQVKWRGRSPVSVRKYILISAVLLSLLRLFWGDSGKIAIIFCE